MEHSFDIIIPVYNAGQTLDKMVGTFLAQDYSSFRLILIDDGSQDDSAVKCAQYAKKSANIVFLSQKNQGPGMARKTGFALTAADYIMFCDADDFVEPGLLRDIDQVLNETPWDVVEFGFRKVTQAGALLPSLRLKDEVVQGSCLEHYIRQVNTANFLWNKAFRRELISLEDFMDLRYSEDACFLANVIKKAHRYIVMGGVYYNYVISPTSACGSRLTPQRLDMIKADKYIMGLLTGEDSYLRPFEAAAACAHAAKLYGCFQVAGILSTEIGLLLRKQFDENYTLLRTRKKEVLQDASWKRRLSIAIFRFSPKLYALLFSIGD